MADEYILKDEVLNLIEHNDRVCHYADERYENVVYATVQTICKVVADIPTADVQPVKHGRWIWDSNAPHREHGAYKCSNCGCHSDFEENYCYNCGARMDLKDGDTE